MRPIRLEFEGFGTFRDRTVVDFSDVDLVGFVGPTGSGKSTVIDALTFALYGSVARYDNTKLVAPVIHMLSVEAKVRFDFSLGGEDYIAVRVVRRSKSKPGAAPRATTREARLERVEGDGSTTVLAGNVKELDEQVQALIGLDFSQFTRTIVLPQGEFAEFLKDDPGNRQKLLRQLLELDIYARMGTVARERASQIAHQVVVYRDELERLSDVDTKGLVQAEAELERLRAFATEVRPNLDQIDALEAELVEARVEVNDLDRRLDLLARVAVDDEVEALDDLIGLERAKLEAAEAALATARQTRDAALAELDQAGDVSTWQKRLDGRDRLDELETEIDSLQHQAERAQLDEREAIEVSANAAQALDSTTAALSAARLQADAASWVLHLSVGEPCPVCQQEVSTIPEHGATPTAIGHAEEAEAAAQNAARAAAATAAKAEGTRKSLEADVAQRQKTLDGLREQFTGLDSRPVLHSSLQNAVAATAAERATSTALVAAETAAAEARNGLTKAEGAETVFRDRFESQRDIVAELGPPRSPATSLIAQWQALAHWAAVTNNELAARRTEVADAGRDLAGRKAEVITELGAAATAVGLAAEPEAMEARAASATASAVAAVERIEERLDRKTDLSDKVTELGERRAVLDSMGQHLAANGFERWLLATALDEIVGRATRLLLQLSNNRYSLEATDGSFGVRDHGNADERRDIRTLSGGEIFLASLALALALAESIADLAPIDSPRMESIFLDEGFGTLDGETLDVLASAIEELSASGRLVAVVTHVRDLADRLPTRFEVRKGPTSSTIERVEG